MEYNKAITLRDGRECILRNGTESDGQAVLNIFAKTLTQTDFLLSCPDEVNFDAEGESRYLKNKTESISEIQLVSEVDGVIVGLAGIDSLGSKRKIHHRADFGISVDRDFWGLGIGRALLNACIECARTAGYEQVELYVVRENERAISLYKQAGFVEFGRNPKGFKSGDGDYQEVVLMRLELI